MQSALLHHQRDQLLGLLRGYSLHLADQKLFWDACTRSHVYMAEQESWLV